MEGEDEWVARMLEDDVLVAQLLMQLMNGKSPSSPPLTSPALRWGRLGRRPLPSTPRLHGWFDGGAMNERAPKPAAPLTLVEAGRHNGSPLSPLEWKTSPERKVGEVADSAKRQKSRKVGQAGDDSPSTSCSRANGEPSASISKLQAPGDALLQPPGVNIPSPRCRLKFMLKPPAPEEPKAVVFPSSDAEASAHPSVAPEIESPVQPDALTPAALTNVAENLPESLPSENVHENADTAETCCGTSLPDCSTSAVLPDLNFPPAGWF